MRKLLYIMGKSASGKDSIYKLLLEQDKELKGVVLYTTRPMRDNEEDGINYHFITEEELSNLNVIEKRCYNTCYGKWYYATVYDEQFERDTNLIAIGTLESYFSICNYLGKDKVIPIYIEVDDKEILLRAINRESKNKEPKYDEVCRRFLADKEDFSKENLLKNNIVKSYKNNDIKECIKNILKDIY